jgi:hypothetical protein
MGHATAAATGSLSELRRAAKPGMLTAMDDRCPECARLRAEREELLAIIRTQRAGLAEFRQRLDAQCDRHVEIMKLVDDCYDAIKRERLTARN